MINKSEYFIVMLIFQ